MIDLMIFAGTTEGRELAEYLAAKKMYAHVCVATEYGEVLLAENAGGHAVHAGRMTAEMMLDMMQKENIRVVVDATHPYAVVVSENIREAAEKANAQYLRLLRDSSNVAEEEDWICVESVQEAVAYLSDREGKILAATGSKELFRYRAIPDYQNRVFARVLSTSESMEIAANCGFQGKNLICMQGPFSEEMNYATLKMLGAEYLVTKESGKTGGFPEKVRAAKRAGALLVVVGRPPQEEGYDQQEIRGVLEKLFAEKVNAKGSDAENTELKAQSQNMAAEHVAIAAEIPAMQQEQSVGGYEIGLIGIGMGTKEGMTREAWEACEQADVLIGAERMLMAAEELDKPFYTAYMSDEIYRFAKEHPRFKRLAVLLSGDLGFYSGAKKLIDLFEADPFYEVKTYCGISSVVHLCGRLHTSWEDVKLISLHGRSQNLIAAVRENKKVFALVGKQESFSKMCEELTAYGFGDLMVHAGCNMSYPEEQILSGTAKELVQAATGDLTAVLIENPQAVMRTTHGFPDEAFLRAKVPMTKSEVRSISLSKLELHRDSVAYDVGAGTGSVSIEMALAAADGCVYAVEKKEEAVALIHENKKKFGASNLKVIEGLAPEALKNLPAPTHAFIGGSSGNMREILELLLKKNPKVRIVMNAIALETVVEIQQCLDVLPVTDVDIVCVNIARAKELGHYHMMMGYNPVYVVSCSGDGSYRA